MMNQRRALLAISTLIIIATLLSACTQSLSQPPAATPTLIADDLFVEPLPSAENPLALIEEFAKQTAAAGTATAGGDPATLTGTPGTPDPAGTETTPQITNTVDPAQAVTPTNANAEATTPVVATTPVENNVNSTPVPAGNRPASYTLQAGEFPYCIARRFNVDPDALLSASGLTSPDIYYSGLVLKIPQTGAFPGDRMLASHPATYSVTSADENLYSIACKYGDVDPASIASANGLSLGANLTVGQQIKIP